MPITITTAVPRWRIEYSVGVEPIDEEHQHLFALAETLYQAIRSGRGREHLQAVLDELIAYTCYHFEREEKLMADIAYPHLDEHRKEHENFRRRVELMCRDSGSGGDVSLNHVLNQTVHWLRCHTMTSDRRIGTYMRRCGILA